MVFGSGQSPILGGYRGTSEDISSKNPVFEILYKKRAVMVSDSWAGMVGDGFPVCKKIHKKPSPKKASPKRQRYRNNAQSLQEV